MTQDFWPEQLEGWRIINHDWKDCEWMCEMCVLLQNKVEFIFLKFQHNFVATLLTLPQLQNHFLSGYKKILL